VTGRAHARSACASAAALVPAWARPAAAAAKAKPRALACASRGSKAAKCRCNRRVPKRGFRQAAFARRLNEINVGRVQAAIEAGKLDPAATVDVGALVKAGVLRRAKDGVRLLGSGEITTKAAFSVWGASKSAVAAVERAGGSVTVLAPKPGTGEQGG